jgi:hypothetical protein
MRQGNILNEATAVSLATFLGEAIRLVIQIVARHSEAGRKGGHASHSAAKPRPTAL